MKANKTLFQPAGSDVARETDKTPFQELVETIGQLEARLRAATSRELTRELGYTLDHFRRLRDERIRALLFDEASA